TEHPVPAPHPTNGKQTYGGKHGHGHGDGHGGGHGGGWAMTSSGMVTPLLCVFIRIITFSSKEQGREGVPRKLASMATGARGTNRAVGQRRGAGPRSGAYSPPADGTPPPARASPAPPATRRFRW